MKTITHVSAAALAVLACAASLQAHHNGSMFDPAPIWVRGTVVRYTPVNPHATLVLEERRADGQVQQWTVEGPQLARIRQMGVEPKVGDVIEACGFALRQGVATRNGSPDPYGSSGRFVHGHALRMPDGHLEMFGPYGKLDNCVRPGDEMQAWLDFLNTDRRARGAWCTGLTFRTPSTAPKAIVDEINSRLVHPCE